MTESYYKKCYKI